MSVSLSLLSSQWCSCQWAVFGAVTASGCASSSTGAGTHSPVAQRPGQSLDSQRRIFTVSQVWIHTQGNDISWPSVTVSPLCVVSRDLHSYLLGEQEDNEANQPVNNNNNNNPPHVHHNNNNNPAPAVGEGLHAAHQAILQQGGPVGFQPYHRPLRFPLRVRKAFFIYVFKECTLQIDV